MSVAQRKELMEKGPFNLVFHGVEPDWIEAEMDDDPDFQRDVLEQKIKAIVRDEVSIEIFKSLIIKQENSMFFGTNLNYKFFVE